MKGEDISDRLVDFSVRIIRLVNALPKNLVGKHVGEFAGIPATGKDVRIPLCVNYDLEDGKIKRARVYFEMPVLLQQLGIELG